MVKEWLATKGEDQYLCVLPNPQLANVVGMASVFDPQVTALEAVAA